MPFNRPAEAVILHEVKDLLLRTFSSPGRRAIMSDKKRNKKSTEGDRTAPDGGSSRTNRDMGSSSQGDGASETDRNARSGTVESGSNAGSGAADGGSGSKGGSTGSR